MKTKFSKLLDSLHSSFWFVPSLMVVLAIGLSFLTIQIDQSANTEIIGNLGWAYALGPNGSRAILSAIAGSMVSVATTAFSITIVALQLASSQFGPRLLEAIAVIASFTHPQADRAALLRHANMIERGSHEGISEELDCKDIKGRYLAAVKAIEQQ